jgi:UPF0755 protein
VSDFGLIRDEEDLGHPGDEAHRPAGGGGGGGRRRPRKRRGWIPALLVLALIGGGIYFAGSYGYDKLKAHFAAAPDYPGPGTGKVVFQVKKGDSVATMGQGLRNVGVVRSVDAFVDAARKEPKASTIQVGFYQLKKQMRAGDALAVLVSPKNMIQSSVTVPEGSRVKSIVAAIVKNTDLKRAAVESALKQPGKLGLPAAAKGNPEGYLYPATYVVPPNLTALGLLRQMVAKTVSVEKDLDLATKAQALGYTPEEILTVASILEFEASRGPDYPKVARAIYNRLDKGMALQSDATVAYANNKSGTVYTSSDERALDSPYNTYRNTGLPPGPIGSPGETTIKAALNPSQGHQLFWVVVNLRTGETRYADNYQDHLKNVALFRRYCQTSDAC